MKIKQEIGVIKLADTEKGIISICRLEEPYGKGSKPVVSIGVSLSGDREKPDWKAHIPYDNIDEVVELLKEAKELMK